MWFIYSIDCGWTRSTKPTTVLVTNTSTATALAGRAGGGGGGGGGGPVPPFLAHVLGFLTLGPKMDPLPPSFLLVGLRIRWTPF